LPIVVTRTPVPANAATAAARAAEATAIAYTTGTPDQTRYVIATPTARPTRRPPATATPFALALSAFTATPPPNDPAPFLPALIGQIIFLGDADGRGGPESYVMNADGTNVLRLTSQEYYNRVAERDSASADQRFRAFVRREIGGNQERQIFAFDAFYNSERQLTTMGDGSTSWDPAWSPTAELVAFVSNESGSDEIWVVDREGTYLRRLTENVQIWNKHPSWSPDGNQIVFTSNRSGQQAIWLMDADGSNQRQLIDPGFAAWDPVWVKYGDQ
jgi:Tol biopolymer transport system component